MKKKQLQEDYDRLDEFYRQEIIEIVSNIQEFRYLESIYWFIKGMFYRKENGTE